MQSVCAMLLSEARPDVQYFFSPYLTKGRHYLKESVECKTCGLIFLQN